MTSWQQAVVLVVLGWSFIFVHIISGAIVMRVFGISVTEAKVGYGKSLFEFKFGSYPLRFGYLPVGGHVSFDVEAFGLRSLLVRLIIVLAPPVLLAVIALLLLGFQEGGRHIIAGFAQFFTVAYSPIQTGVPLLRKFFELAANAPALMAGVLAAKLAAFNLLPIPTLAGGRALSEIFKLDLEVPWLNRIALVLLLLTWLVFIGWVIAMFHYFFR